MRKNRLYIIATYKNKSILNDDITDWSNDLRVKIFGGRDKFIRGNRQSKLLPINSEFLYVGEYYHQYNTLRKKDIVNDKESVALLLQYELGVINRSDIVLAVIDRGFSYYSAIKLFNAVINNKEVTVFIDSDDIVVYKKWQYFLKICQNINVNMMVINNTFTDEDIVDYIKTLKKSPDIQPLRMCYNAGKILEETRLFLSTNFVFASKDDITVNNVTKCLKNDIRTLIVADKGKSLIENSDTYIMHKRYLKYNGSFYYYLDENSSNNTMLCVYKEMTKGVMKRISSSDVFICVLKTKEQMNSVIELLYAAFLKRKIHVFYDKSIMGESFDNSYHLLILFASILSDNVKLTAPISDNKVLEFIKNL